MDYAEIVKKLVGQIEPVGETHTDEKRFENLKQMTALVDQLICEIQEVAEFRDRVESSLARSGRHAHNFLLFLREEQTND